MKIPPERPQMWWELDNPISSTQKALDICIWERDSGENQSKVSAVSYLSQLQSWTRLSLVAEIEFRNLPRKLDKQKDKDENSANFRSLQKKLKVLEENIKGQFDFFYYSHKFNYRFS